MSITLTHLPLGSVKLLPGLFQLRYDLNRRYMLSLKTENLLQNFYMEAGLWNPAHQPGNIHWGWESPTSQLRGHFLGHWLSTAAVMFANTGDVEIKGKADYIVNELARCQRENGGEWAGSIPTQYLDWAARGKPVWAPHYTLHKTLMGLALCPDHHQNTRGCCDPASVACANQWHDYWRDCGSSYRQFSRQVTPPWLIAIGDVMKSSWTMFLTACMPLNWSKSLPFWFRTGNAGLTNPHD